MNQRPMRIKTRTSELTFSGSPFLYIDRRLFILYPKTNVTKQSYFRKDL